MATSSQSQPTAGGHSQWIDYGGFFLNTAPQQTPEWEEARNQLRATTSTFGAIRLYMEGRGSQPHLPGTKIVQNDAMRLGTALESPIRVWFQDNSGYLPTGAKIQELGVAVPKFYPKIGGSTDGLILVGGKAEGLIEIKTTAKIYESLLSRQGRPEDYISDYHYDQMQGCMAILNMPYCYYIVYEHTTNAMHIEKVMKNDEYWNKRLFPAIYTYIESGFKRGV